jgi:hypothetical protein
MTKTEAIFNYLVRGNSITSMDAITLFKATRLSGHIYHLRKLGCDILSEGEDSVGYSHRYARYTLKSWPPSIRFNKR